MLGPEAPGDRGRTNDRRRQHIRPGTAGKGQQADPQDQPVGRE
jgi:hypothetical protein